MELLHIAATSRAQVGRSQIQERLVSTEISNNEWVICFLNFNELNYSVVFQRGKIKILSNTNKEDCRVIGEASCVQ